MCEFDCPFSLLLSLSPSLSLSPYLSPSLCLFVCARPSVCLSVCILHEIDTSLHSMEFKDASEQTPRVPEALKLPKPRWLPPPGAPPAQQKVWRLQRLRPGKRKGRCPSGFRGAAIAEGLAFQSRCKLVLTGLKNNLEIWNRGHVAVDASKAEVLWQQFGKQAPELSVQTPLQALLKFSSATRRCGLRPFAFCRSLPVWRAPPHFATDSSVPISAANAQLERIFKRAFQCARVAGVVLPPSTGRSRRPPRVIRNLVDYFKSS